MPKNWQNTFLTLCVGLMTPAVLGAFAFLWNLNATVATMSANDVRQDVELKEVKIKIEDVRNDVSANALEIFKVKTECEARWNRKGDRP